MRPIETKDLSITFHAKRCIHARRCVLGLPDVFRPGESGGWIFPEGADTETVVKVIETCPSGALAYQRKNGGAESTPLVNTARLWENGPIEVRGDLRLGDAEAGTRALLCRCGQSATKPFCDGSHGKAGFVATAEPATTDKIETPETRDGPLTLAPQPNGPLKIDGALEIVAGSGRRIATGERVFLCRCGQSGNKPFCDGSHKAAGFTAD